MKRSTKFAALLVFVVGFAFGACGDGCGCADEPVHVAPAAPAADKSFVPQANNQVKL